MEDNAVGLDAGSIAINIFFEQGVSESGNAAQAFVNITGTYNYTPIIPLVIPIAGGDGIDFTDLQVDLVSTIRMALVIPP